MKNVPTTQELETRFLKLYETHNRSYGEKLKKLTKNIKEQIKTRLNANGYEWLWLSQDRMDNREVYAEVVCESQYSQIFDGEIYNMVKSNYWVSEEKQDLAVIINYRQYSESKALYEFLNSDFYTKELASRELYGKLEQKLDNDKEVKKKIKI